MLKERSFFERWEKVIKEMPMGKSRHTPGPWFHYTGKLRPQFPTIIHEIQADDGTSIVKWGGFDGVDYSERKIGANALLMAAAPELLEALKGAIPYLKQNTPAMVRGALNNAIAKAEHGPSIGPEDFQHDHKM